MGSSEGTRKTNKYESLSSNPVSLSQCKKVLMIFIVEGYFYTLNKKNQKNLMQEY